MYPAIQAFFADPNKEAKRYDYAITSPKMVSGLGITERHFTKHYGIFTGVIQPTSAAQMLERDRTAKDMLIAVPNRNTCRKKGPSVKTMKALELNISQYANCVLRNYENEIETRKDYASAILYALRQAGHKTKVASDAVFRVPKATKKRLKQLADEISKEEIERIVAHPEYPAEVIREIEKIEAKTSTDQEILLSSKIRKELLTKPEKKDVEFVKRDGLEKMKNLECLLATKEKVRAFDDFERSQHDVIDRYHAEKRGQFLKEFLGILRIREDLNGYFDSFDAKRAQKFCEKNWETACLLFPALEGINPKRYKYGMPLVKKLLREIGLTDIEIWKNNGEMAYTISYDQRNQISGYLDRRREARISFLDPKIVPLAA